jgi:hypothetical protein
VSGVLTRLLSQRPDAKPLQLIAAITENTNRLTIPAATPQDTKLGYGGLDAQKATARMTTPQSSVQIYAYNPVSTGNILNSAQPAEASGSYHVQSCESGSVGSTPIFDLAKTGSRFLSVSQSEIWQATLAGYSASFFAHACLQQPHDTFTEVRALDMFAEFRNTYKILR